MPAMGSLVLPWLAAAIAFVPSKQPDSPSPVRVSAKAAASVFLTRATRIDWSDPDLVIVARTGPSGEERYDREFE